MTFWHSSQTPTILVLIFFVVAKFTVPAACYLRGGRKTILSARWPGFNSDSPLLTDVDWTEFKWKHQEWNTASSIEDLPSNEARTAYNGYQPNGHVSRQDINGIKFKSSSNGVPIMALISVLKPEQFNKNILTEENWINTTILGAGGVGSLERIEGVKNADGRECEEGDICVLSDRHINPLLQAMLCDETPLDEADIFTVNNSTSVTTVGGGFRYLFSTLLNLAWPENVQLWLCCTEDSDSSCTDPRHVFGGPLASLSLAPHFLTQEFGQGQQEALTAALIAKINVHGIRLEMDLAGTFDLGAAGVKVLERENPDVFRHALGKAWGNVFLDCSGDDFNRSLCESSKEKGRELGRDPQYHHLPMFTCNGGSDYPTKVSGKGCFSKDMATNEADGCSLVASTGMCSDVCMDGMCGVNQPPILETGTYNVLDVYMGDYDEEND